ncbi:MAG: hypothetical protein CM15mP40_04680 [Alphaproteobacteria bacterium]|nr:MAG: hypothetical protein CM15mP40_04680 [Alphaproteobacteria bacterium]
MIMINNYLKYCLIFSVFVLNSCETLQDFAGLNKPDLEIDLFEETPELVLPPDFGKVAKRNKYRNEKIINQTPDFSDNFQQSQYQSIQPRVTNYIAPRINIESSPTPSDSLERFKENKKFTIGQWVYGQYIQGFKQGNLYYRPIYDKGYNFSRRYLPDQNITSFLRPQQQYIENANRRESIPMDSNFQNLENLPIID